MRCQVCNKGALKQTIKPQTFAYKSKSITLRQPGLWCDSCEEGVLSGEDIAATEQAFEEFKAKTNRTSR